MRSAWRWLFPLCAAALLSGCSAQVREKPVEPALVWPADPEPARIAFVRAFTRPDDLGISKGFLQRVRDLVFGEEESRMVRPMAVIESGGVLYVADPGAKGVHRFDTVKGNYALILGPEETPLPSPVGLARGADGEIYIADSRLARVLVIRPGEKFASPLELEGELLQPTGLAFDTSSRELFVVDTKAHRIKVFNARGASVRSIGERGAGAGEFNYPTLLWLSSQGRLYVTDSLNFRVQILDRDGRFVGKFGHLGDGTGDASRQKGVATDRRGHVYVVDSLFHAVQVFDEGGRFLLTVGAQGQGRGEFWLPVGVHIDANDTIYIADTYNRRVQMLRYVGGDS
jgi:DNA-binding beta-propeller fold protein YncE